MNTAELELIEQLIIFEEVALRNTYLRIYDYPDAYTDRFLKFLDLCGYKFSTDSESTKVTHSKKSQEFLK